MFNPSLHPGFTRPALAPPSYVEADLGGGDGHARGRRRHALTRAELTRPGHGLFERGRRPCPTGLA
eukprot:scaffold26176_cov66-Phaeocystis_antarctica.AAC.3